MKRNIKITYSFNNYYDYENCKDSIIDKFGHLTIMTWDERKEIAILDSWPQKEEVQEILIKYNGINITDYKYKERFF